MSSPKPGFRPFHETIVERIEGASGKEIGGYGRLLMQTLLPENHKKIEEVWRRRASFLNLHPASIEMVAAKISCQKKEPVSNKNPFQVMRENVLAAKNFGHSWMGMQDVINMIDLAEQGTLGEFKPGF